MNQHQVTDPSVEAVIANYRPRHIDLYHWLKISEFVQQAVTESQPPSVDEARRRMTGVAALTDWVAYVACFPTERRTVFDLDVMAEFIDIGNDWSPKVKKMERGRLKTMARLLNPNFPKDLPEETAYSSAWDPKPYTTAEVATLEDWARGQRTAGRRLKAQVLLALTLGAGLYSHEVVRLRVGDITVDDDGVLLNLKGQKPREVPVHADYEQVLVDLVANVPENEYTFSPGRTNRKSSVIHNFIKGTNRNSGVYPNPQRMRATWLVDHIKAGVPAPVLVKASGLTNLRSFERWVYSFPEFDKSEHRMLMRKSRRDTKQSG